MPTKKPRINLSVSQDLYDVIRRFAQATNTPITTVVMDVVEAAKPVFEVNAELAETASKMKPAEKLQIAKVMDALEYKYADRQLSTEQVLQAMLTVAQGTVDVDQLDIEDYLKINAEELPA